MGGLVHQTSGGRQPSRAIVTIAAAPVAKTAIRNVKPCQRFGFEDGNTFIESDDDDPNTDS